MARIYIMILIGLLALAGCERIPSDEDRVLIPLHFVLSESPVTEVGSKAPVTSPGMLRGTYEFGAFIYDQGTTNPHMEGFGEIKSTAKKASDEGIAEWIYTFNGIDHEAISIANSCSIDVYSYYPYVENQTDHTAIRFTTDEQKDWMWAIPVQLTTDYASTSAEAVLVFNHMMTCIEVHLKNKYEGNIKLTHVKLTDTKAVVDPSTGEVTSSLLYSGGTFNAATGAVSPETPVKEITITPETSNMAIINNGSGTSVHFIIPEISDYESGRLQFSFCFNGLESSTKYDIPLLTSSNVDNGTTVTEGVLTGFKTGYKYKYSFIIDNTMDFHSVTVDASGWKNGGETERTF